MKNAAAGLLVAMGLFVCSKAHAEPSSRSAASEGARAKTVALRGEAKTGETPAPVVEAPAVEPSLTLFHVSDGNRDGSVSYGELAAVVRNSIARRIKARFHQLDRNHDGRVARREVNKMNAARFARFDVNRDGVFTLAELAHVMTHEAGVRLRDVYARLDGDRDGRLSMAELAPQPKQPARTVVAKVGKDAGRKVAEVAKRVSTVH